MEAEKEYLKKPAFLPSNAKPLRGEYTTLEGLTYAHCESLWRNLGFPDAVSATMTWILDWPWQCHKSPEDIWKYLSGLQTKVGVIFYAVMGDPNHLNPGISSDPKTGIVHNEALGILALSDIKPQNRSLEVGALFGPALQRTAAATEGHYMLLRSVCESNDPRILPAYRRIVWKCDRLNRTSSRAAQRMGYVHEGTFRKHLIQDNGTSRDTEFFCITDDDWPAIQVTVRKWLERTNFNAGKQVKSIEEIRNAIN